LIISVNIVNHALPALSVTVNGGIPTYEEFKTSLGHQVYKVKDLYLYSDVTTQLTGALNYNMLDADGNKQVTNIVTTVTPYQTANALTVNLDKTSVPIILNGNSSVATKILPNAFLRVILYTKRITNSFNMPNNFDLFEPNENDTQPVMPIETIAEVPIEIVNAPPIEFPNKVQNKNAIINEIIIISAITIASIILFKHLSKK
jgi:hypothetical protein